MKCHSRESDLSDGYTIRQRVLVISVKEDCKLNIILFTESTLKRQLTNVDKPMLNGCECLYRVAEIMWHRYLYFAVFYLTNHIIYSGLLRV